MRDAIVAKLQTLLDDGIDSECEVVYLLCEIRKLFDKTPAHERPFALNMYCHWALQVDLSGTDTIMPFLRQVDDYVHGMLVGPEDIPASSRMVREFVLLDTFKLQLRDFLVEYGLPTELTDDAEAWSTFVTQYAGVIEDGALVCRAQNHGLRHVKQVTFTKGRPPLGEFNELPFGMLWCIALLDGRSAEVEVSVRLPKDSVGPMVGWRFHLNP